MNRDSVLNAAAPARRAGSRQYVRAARAGRGSRTWARQLHEATLLVPGGGKGGRRASMLCAASLT